MPAYNSAKFLPAAIASIQQQSFSDHEIIVVDDGSTDNTYEVMLGYGDQITALQQENAGSATARNTGIAAAGGELIAFLDSDDYWDSNHLENLLNRLNEVPEAVLAYSGKRRVSQEGALLDDAPHQTTFPQGWIFHEMFHSNYISTSSAVVVKKSAVTRVGGFDQASSFRNAQDYELWLRIAARFEIAAVPQESVNYRRHDGNRTLDSVNRIRGMIATLESAKSLVASGTVHPRNKPERIDVLARMTSIYRHGVNSLFYGGHYEAVREVGSVAAKKGYLDHRSRLRWILSYLPMGILKVIRGGDK